MMKIKIKILGQPYRIVTDDSIIERNVDGLAKEYSKEIIIRPEEKMLDDSDRPEEKEARYKEVLRHELIHAFFSEAGLDDYSCNEQLVNWLAMQFPKMEKVFKKAGALQEV